MRFQTRLILTYSTLVAVLALLAGIFIGQYNIRIMEEGAVQDLQLLSENASAQLDETVRPMEFITEFLLSDRTTLNAILLLANVGDSDTRTNYVNLAAMDLKTSLVTYCIDENFHRVNVFSRRGDFLTSNVLLRSVRTGEADYRALPSIHRVEEAAGRTVIIPPHPDTWDLESPETVFSLARMVMGGVNPCYIEVQKPLSVLEGIYSFDRQDQIRMLAVNRYGEILYSGADPDLSQSIRSRLLESPPAAGETFRLEDSIVAVHYSPYTGVYSVAVQSSEALRATSTSMMTLTFVVAGLICALSIVFISLTSRRLAAPIRQLTSQMERTNLDNLESGVELAHTNDEIARLNSSYNHLMQRLNQAVFREQQLTTLQAQAEFDALQAQVNPHFLYNTLNVVSHRGLLNGDEIICDICERLAAMLRYSTGTSRRIVTIGDEMQYVEHYLYLLGTRYREKLRVDMDIDPEIENQPIPKIVLQQLVENSINHGFRNTSGEMHIRISGWAEGGLWYLRVEDNGSGFDPNALAALEATMEETRRQVLEGNHRLKLEIGGLGLVNTYARLLIFFGEGLVCRLRNREPGPGADVLVGAEMKQEESQCNTP